MTERRASACRVAEVSGRVDLLPLGGDGLALRLVTPDRAGALAELRRARADGEALAGIGRVAVDEPRPTMAVVIDDLGLHPGQLVPFWVLGQPITWSLLPDAPHTEAYARWLGDHGASMLVHVPMEPVDPEQMHQGAYLLADQRPAERAERLEAMLAAIPGAVGVSSHMGSRLTADRAVMDEVVAALPPHLVVLDSRTTPDSQLEAAARAAGRPAARRTAFIDNVRREDAILAALTAAWEGARPGEAVIAIGHPYPETARALARFLAAHGDDLHLVPIERLTDPPVPPRWLADCN